MAKAMDRLRTYIGKRMKRNMDCELETKLPMLWERYAELVNEENGRIEGMEDVGERVGEVGGTRTDGIKASE